MKNLGIGLLAIGVVVTIGALFMSTSVATEPPTSYYGRTTNEVYNLGLLQHQMMIFAAGLAMTVSGVALAAAGVVLDTLGMHVIQNARPVPSEEAIEASPQTVAERELTPEELKERDRDLNRATFMVAGGMLAVVGIIFLIVMMAS